MRPISVDVAGAAQLLGISERFVRKLDKEKRLPRLQIGGSVRYLLSDLEEFAKSCRRGGVDE